MYQLKRGGPYMCEIELTDPHIFQKTGLCDSYIVDKNLFMELLESFRITVEKEKKEAYLRANENEFQKIKEQVKNQCSSIDYEKAIGILEKHIIEVNHEPLRESLKDLQKIYIDLKNNQ